MLVKAPGRLFIVLKSVSQSDWDLQNPSARVAWTLKPFQYAFAPLSVAGRARTYDAVIILKERKEIEGVY
jgi:hypothetical protein